MIEIAVKVRYDGERKLTVTEHVDTEAELPAAVAKAADAMVALIARNHDEQESDQ